MRIQAIASAFAIGLTGLAQADVLPEPPVDPIPEACKPLIGIWQRAEPERTRWSTNWEIMVIDSRRVTMLYYVNQKDVNIEAQTGLFNVSCTPGEGGAYALAFSTATDEEGEFGMDVVLSGDSFTTTAETYYDQPGAPPADWKPETYQVTWTRIAK